MSTVIVIEIVLGLVLLAGVVRFAIRDTRRRNAGGSEGYSEPEQAAETPERTAEVPEHSSEQEAEQPVSEVADRA